MDPKTLGNLFVISWIGIAIIYDCIVYFIYKQPLATISDTLRSWVQFSPLILVPFGGLLWHLFGVQRQLSKSYYAWEPLGVLIIGIILYAICGIGSTPPIGPPLNHPHK